MSEHRFSCDESIRIVQLPPSDPQVLPSTKTSESVEKATPFPSLKPPLISPPPGISALSGGGWSPEWSSLPATFPDRKYTEELLSQQPIPMAASAPAIFSEKDTPDEIPASQKEINRLIIYLALAASLAALGFQIWILL